MNKEKITDLMLGKISDKEFKRIFFGAEDMLTIVNTYRAMLEKALEEKSADEIDWLFYIGFKLDLFDDSFVFSYLRQSLSTP